MGLLALMLLHESRRARANLRQTGELVLLEDQDRTLWNRDQIEEGLALVSDALASRQFGPYTRPSGDRGRPCRSTSAGRRPTGPRIVGLYDLLLRIDRVAGGRVEPCRGRGDARRTVRGFGADRRAFSPAAIWPTITWLTRRGPICAAGWARRRGSSRLRQASFGPAGPGTAVPRNSGSAELPD